MVENKQQLIAALEANRERILSFGVKRLGLFGSFVRNEANKESDVDFLVDFKKGKKTLENLVGVHDLLHEASDRKVEVVTRKGLSRKFRKHILNETEFIVWS